MHSKTQEHRSRPRAAAAGIVLAGGRSTRMGRPKAALEWHGSTLLHRETSAKVIGLCHGHYGYLDLCDVLGLDPARVTW